MDNIAKAKEAAINESIFIEGKDKKVSQNELNKILDSIENMGQTTELMGLFLERIPKPQHAQSTRHVSQSEGSNRNYLIAIVALFIFGFGGLIILQQPKECHPRQIQSQQYHDATQPTSRFSSNLPAR